LTAILEQLRQTTGHLHPDVTLLGFSNGGYLLLRLWLLRELNMVRRCICFGSGVEIPKTSVLGSTSELILVIGKDDKYHYLSAKEGSSRLNDLKLEHTFSEFVGGHELSLAAISSIFVTKRDT
jgi:predicted esterase